MTGTIKHMPRPVMRLLSQVARPFTPTFARTAQGGVVMDTTDMTFDAAALRIRFSAACAGAMLQLPHYAIYPHVGREAFADYTRAKNRSASTSPRR